MGGRAMAGRLWAVQVCGWLLEVSPILVSSRACLYEHACMRAHFGFWAWGSGLTRRQCVLFVCLRVEAIKDISNTLAKLATL